MVSFTSLFVATFAALSVAAVPLKRATITDTDVLQYALTLEHLEAAFYNGALAKYDAAAFKKAGFEPFVRHRFQQIANHEKEHVDLLTSAIGPKATKACTYTFPYTDPKSFAALSAVLENGGVSAYLGAAKYITNKTYLTVAGSILTTEARHQGWVSSAVEKGAGWSSAFDTPLDFDQIYSIVAPFIDANSCPSTNPKLPVKAFPTASYTLKGNTVTLKYKSSGKTEYLVLFSGLTTSYHKISNGKATLPAGQEGTSFAVISTSSSSVSDDNTVAGPIIFSFPVPETAQN